jgi:hypothetical protein
MRRVGGSLLGAVLARIGSVLVSLAIASNPGVAMAFEEAR